ncbi:general secretion pathway protein B [Janthinobacterium sp. CG_23.3]|uniref:general secretion pathway protein GspB n=1 Tax=Janthinobacterium sp. CG_23.3 TaxID=3349634 RepID=UPI0038D37DCC
MSYILEALKKSQAERQLGELPTIHAPQLRAGAPGVAGRALAKPLWLALGGMTALALTLAALMWRAAAPPAAPAGVAVATAPPASPTPAVAPPPSGMATGAAAAAPAPVGVAAVAASVHVPAAVAVASPAPPPAPPRRPMAAPHVASASASAKPVLPAPAPAAQSAPPATPADDNLAGLRDLPEPIQRQIPPLALGGYIYSKNPADRLLLVDKALRHEGEEVAPGLILEKLQPKSAVFSFKGYRYRVPY